MTVVFAGEYFCGVSARNATAIRSPPGIDMQFTLTILVFIKGIFPFNMINPFEIILTSHTIVDVVLAVIDQSTCFSPWVMNGSIVFRLTLSSKATFNNPSRCIMSSTGDFSFFLVPRPFCLSNVSGGLGDPSALLSWAGPCSRLPGTPHQAILTTPVNSRGCFFFTSPSRR